MGATKFKPHLRRLPDMLTQERVIGHAVTRNNTEAVLILIPVKLQQV